MIRNIILGFILILQSLSVNSQIEWGETLEVYPAPNYGAVIEWTTTYENFCLGFEIIRTNQFGKTEVLDTLDCNSKGEFLTTYRYNDVTCYLGINKYYVKAIANRSSYKVSRVGIYTHTDNSLRVFFNKKNNNLFIANATFESNLFIFDLRDKQVHSSQTVDGRFLEDLSKLSTGTYNVYLPSEKIMYTIRIEKSL